MRNNQIKTTIKIDKELREKAKKVGINLSKFVETKLKEELKKMGYEV